MLAGALWMAQPSAAPIDLSVRDEQRKAIYCVLIEMLQHFCSEQYLHLGSKSTAVGLMFTFQQRATRLTGAVMSLPMSFSPPNHQVYPIWATDYSKAWFAFTT